MAVRIELKNLSKNFEDLKAVDSVDLTIEEGLLYVILGPSGCGKTTTIRMIAGLETPTSGSICIGGEDLTRVPPHGRDLGLVFQNYALFPHMNVEDNVAFGVRMRAESRDRIAERVQAALALVKLTGLERRRPRQLSGGQQQRVALARALVIRPRALLLDEPLSNLDKNLRDEMRFQVKELQQRLGITTVMVTHDQEEALAIGDRIVVMREGLIEQIGTGEEIYRRPATLFVARFLGTANIFQGTLSGDGHLCLPDGLSLPVNETGRKGDPAALIIRPADARMNFTDTPPDSTILSGTLCNSIYQGSIRRHIITITSGEEFYVEASDHGERAPKPGTPVTISYDPQRCHVLKGISDEK